MRDFRDAKAMARSLRDALNAKALQTGAEQTTHSESLELIAKAFSLESWNVLSARIDAAQPPVGAKMPEPPARLLHCSFCGKDQNEVSKLVAGPAVFICDKCIGLCSEIVDEQLLRLIEGDAASARAMSTDELVRYVELADKGAERNRLVLQEIDEIFRRRENASVANDDKPSSSGFAKLMQRTSDELMTMRTYSQDQLSRYEQALRTANSVIAERSA
ncbi:hypothetical protein ACVMB0_006902 [Bradyrhizobium sp. USDA 4451]